MTDVMATGGVPFPTPEQKKHWLRMRIRRLEEHLVRLAADLKALHEELARMEAEDESSH